jgi:hypothetical protein
MANGFCDMTPELIHDTEPHGFCRIAGTVSDQPETFPFDHFSMTAHHADHSALPFYNATRPMIPRILSTLIRLTNGKSNL